MGDVADLLGVERAEAPDPLALALADPKKGKKGEKRAPKPVGMSREVYALLGEQGLPPSMPSKKATFKRGASGEGSGAAAGGGVHWEWAAFANSARADGVQFMHWVKAAAEHPDYPYAKYNVKTEGLTYGDDEYEALLADASWSREDTDQLVRLCARHDMCWPVIADRFQSGVMQRPVEQLQARFYSVAGKLQAARTAAGGRAAPGGPLIASAVPGADVFNLEYEQRRRHQLELQFRKTPAMEREEESLREELKSVEAQIRKLRHKRKGEDGEKLAAEAAALRDAGRGLAARVGGGGGHPNQRPVGRPYLQSHRLSAAFQVPSHQLGKSLMKKVQMVLAELHVPDQPLATQAVCDMQDALKRDVVTLLTLQKVAAKKEADLQQLKQQLQLHAQGHSMALDAPAPSLSLGLQLGLTGAGMGLGGGSAAAAAAAQPGVAAPDPRHPGKGGNKRKSTGPGTGGPGKGKRMKK